MKSKCSVTTQVTREEQAALKLLCLKRFLATGQKVSMRGLLYSLLKAELQEAITNKEISLEELELKADDFTE